MSSEKIFGKIHSSVGFTKVDGYIRRTLTIRERLNQIAMSKQSGILKHRMLGDLEITSERAQELLNLYPEEQLIRLKRLLFMPLGEKK